MYLYFLILGGISFTAEERRELGVTETSSKKNTEYDEEFVFLRFKNWLDDALKYDLPDNIPGIWALMSRDRDEWVVQSFLMKYFYIDEFEGGSIKFDPETIELNHVRDIPVFTWKDENENRIKAHLRFLLLLDRYKEEPGNKMNRIQAMIIGMDKDLQLIHFRV